MVSYSRLFGKGLLLGLFLLNVSSCSHQYYRNKANDEFAHYAYSKAARNYEKSLRKRENANVRILLGDCYRLMNYTEEAEVAYQSVMKDTSLRNKVILPYTKVLIENGRHSLASVLLTDYLKSDCNNSEACVLNDCCNRIKELKRNEDIYSIREVQVPGLLNAFSPVQYKNGLIVSGEVPAKGKTLLNPWTGNSYLNMYYTEVGNDGKWTFPVTLSGISSAYHEASPTLASNDSVMYFTRSNLSEGKLNKDSKNTNHLKIYTAKLNTCEWTNVKEFPFNSDEFSNGHPCISNDGKLMFFTSDRPGGLGGSDIYYSELKGSQWSEPKNAGDLINSAGNEVFPYIAPDNKFYFSTDGKPGMGGLDIFYAQLNDRSFSEPQNLGAPLNSIKDDFGLTMRENGKAGYLSSARSGVDMIYEFVKRTPSFLLMGKVTDKKTGEPIKGSKVIITSQDNNSKQELLTDEEGKYWLAIGSEVAYDIHSLNDEYYKSETKFMTNKGEIRSKNYEVDFVLEKIEMEKPIVIPNIYYSLNKWDLNDASKQGLERLVQLMTENPSINIELSSHTDARSSDKYNMTLSQKRAQSAVDYIISKGIKSSRIIAKGYGETQLLNKCINDVKCPEEDHGVNRRTEFKVIRLTAANTK